MEGPVTVHKAISGEVGQLKRLHQALAAATALQLLEPLPQDLPAAAGLVQHQPFFNLVVTNVPGPPVPLYALGAKLLEAFPFMPLAGNQSLAVAALSYEGQLNLGVLSDPVTCRDVFTQGGWGQRSTKLGDAAGTAMGERMAAGGGLIGWLFEKWTYEQLLSYWNRQPDSPFTPALNNTPKYVVSTSLTEPLVWPNSTLLREDILNAVGTLKVQSNGVLAIMGSGRLISSLMVADLIDEYLLMIHPLVLGTGRRLIPEGVEVKLCLTDSVATPSGVVAATYEPARDNP